jgi:DNA invertase Pin-like site-specific DNA recombinase
MAETAVLSMAAALFIKGPIDEQSAYPFVHLAVLPFLNNIVDNATVKPCLIVMSMKYAFAYLRVSTEEQTVQNQKLVLEKWAQANSYQILDFFEDSAVSGKVPAAQRRGFQEMLEIVKTAGVDAVLVYELSRVGRTFWETLDAIKAIEQYAPLVSCSPRESFLQTTEPSVRKLMIGILTWVAERERDMLVQRTKDGMSRARVAGKEIGRPQKTINRSQLITLLAENQPKAKIAKSLGVSRVTLYKELRQLR